MTSHTVTRFNDDPGVDARAGVTGAVTPPIADARGAGVFTVRLNLLNLKFSPF